MQCRCIHNFSIFGNSYMRIIAIILSILTITLSALPCDDEVIIDSEQLTFVSQSADNHSHSANDLCTPFCVCVCCASIVIEPNIQQDISNSVISTSELNTYYIVSFSGNFLDRIFQPPQV